MLVFKVSLMLKIAQNSNTYHLCIGQYTTSTGATECLSCPEGYYLTNPFQTAAIDCDGNYGDGTSTPCSEDFPICMKDSDGAYCSNVCTFCPYGKLINRNIIQKMNI